MRGKISASADCRMRIIARFAAHFCAIACLTAGASSVQAAEPTNAPFQVQSELVQKAGGELYTFYAQRNYRPLWLDSAGAPTPAANVLIQLIETSEYDGLDPANLDLPALKAAVDGTSPDRSQAELLISKAFIAYAQALLSSSGSALLYEHDSLRPHVSGPYHLLQEAALAPSLSDHIGQMKWMHPLYAPLRRNLAPTLAIDDPVRQLAIGSLVRIRGIPASRRHVIVDVASARLWMYEDGRAVDSMRVVVGRATTRTPLLAGYIRYAILNPYWNVPAELVSKNIAANVLRRGVGYLSASGYEVLSDWSDSPSPIDPRKVDWKAAARGELDLRVRQRPRPGNAMGKVKYEFPNQQGIYLHDTPEKGLMQRDARQFSAGCIRLEDAERLGRWLMRGQLPTEADRPETRVDLPSPIPIYLTYLTAHAKDGQIVLGPDPYGMDAQKRPALATR